MLFINVLDIPIKPCFYTAFFVCQQCDDFRRTRLIFNINLHYANIETPILDDGEELRRPGGK